MLLAEPSGNLFGMTQDAGMGWNPADVNGTQVLIVSTQGGLREPDGRPVALGFHTGHWEIGLLVRAAAETLRDAGVVPVCRLRQRSVRRTHAGHGRDVRQPAVSQRRGDHHAAADSIAAPPRRRDRHRHLRQGAAGDDAGAGRLRPSARHRGPRRRHAAGDRRRGRRQDPVDRRALRARPDHAGRRGGAGLPGLRHARRRLPVPRARRRRRRSWPKRSG